MGPLCPRCGEPGAHGGDGDGCIAALRKALEREIGYVPEPKPEVKRIRVQLFPKKPARSFSTLRWS